jgi:mono/diheme cytochrome c family protein
VRDAVSGAIRKAAASTPEVFMVRKSHASIAALAAAFAVACAFGGSSGETSQAVERGAAAFAQRCAVCHGAGGAGDGPAAAALDPPPADLRRIAARRGGVFPEAQIQRIIDGRDPILAHGSREMPIWGKRMPAVLGGGLGAEGERRGQIKLLVEYLKTIQLAE